MRWLRRAAYWLRFRSEDADLREELAAHRHLLASSLERGGMPEGEAAQAARRAMGNETYMREESRGVWMPPRLEAMWQDWRYAWRGLRRSPAFALVAVSSLALGIGANTAIFGLIHALLLAKVPVAHAGELVELQREVGPKGRDERFTRAEFDALAGGPIPITVFETVNATVDLDGVAATLSVDVVEGGYFDLLGLRPQRGRLISHDDERATLPVIVISDALWRGRLAGDPRAVGKVIKINDQPFTIVGITPPAYAGLRLPAISAAAVPLRSAAAFGILRERDTRQQGVTIVGRRPVSKTIDQTRDALGRVWSACCAAGQLVTAMRGQVAAPATLQVVDVSRGIPNVKMDLRGHYAQILLALMAGVGVLLLAACANVANLLLARSSARSGELAIRLAMGASRPRVVGQLVVESVQLSLAVAAAGALLARWGNAVLAHSNAVGDLSVVIKPTIAPVVLIFTVVVSLASGLLFGLVPAARVMRSDLITPLRQGGRRASRVNRGLLDRGLVAVQVALALLLVTGAMLLVETLRNLQHTDLGFDPVNRIMATVETRRTPYQQEGMTLQRANEMLRRVRALPGVRSAAFASLIPIAGGRTATHTVTVPGAPPPADGNTDVAYTAVTTDYFVALGTKLLAGRDIPPAVEGSPVARRTRDVVVNEQFARRYFPAQNAVGRLFEDSGPGDTAVTENRIVGVAAGARFTAVRAPPTPAFFVPIVDHEWPYLELVVRTTLPVAVIGPDITRAILAVAPGINQSSAGLLTDAIDDALSRERVAAALATLFGIVALCLVAVGLYGVMLYQVTERTPEIGIRMALGARAGVVVSLVLRQSFLVVGIGLAAGLPLALFAGRAVESQLYGIKAFSVSALAAGAASLAIVALAASLVPVRRAVAVDPLTALRAE